MGCTASDRSEFGAAGLGMIVSRFDEMDDNVALQFTALPMEKPLCSLSEVQDFGGTVMDPTATMRVASPTLTFTERNGKLEYLTWLRSFQDANLLDRPPARLAFRLE